MSRDVDVAIIGAGSAGLYALGQVRHHTDNYVLIDGGPLGTTCARVGCMPSKLMIQVADDYHHRHRFEQEGISGMSAMHVRSASSLEHVRLMRDAFVGRVLANSTGKMSESHFIAANARFVDAHTLETDDGQRIRARRIIIATGSRPVVPGAWAAFSDHVFTTDEIFELPKLPETVAVIGLGVIGLELGQAMSRLGVQVTGIDQQRVIGGIVDPVVNAAAIDIIGDEFPLWLGQPAQLATAGDGRVRVTAGERSVEVDAVLASLGRRPNLDGLNLEAAGLTLEEDGVPRFDPQTLQVGDTDIFIAGDCTNTRPVLHEAGFEGRLAGFNAGRDVPLAFRRQTPLGITFCDPNIVSVGAQLDELDPERIVIGEQELKPSGRAMVMGRNRGVIRVYADKADGRLLGAAMTAIKGEDLAHLVAWSIELGLTVPQLLAMPFYHPTLEEALQGALYNAKSQLEIDWPDWPVELKPA